MKIAKKLIKINVVGFALALFLMCVLSIDAYAVSLQQKSINIGTGNAPNVQGLLTQINTFNHEGAYISRGQILQCDANGKVTFWIETYNQLSAEEKQSFMVNALAVVRSSSLGTKSKNQLYNFIAECDSTVSQSIRYLTEDTMADLVTARSWLRPFSSTISKVTGFLSIFIFLILGLGMLFDIAYLALPLAQLALEKGEPNKKPFGVSAEAWKVNREISGDINNSKNVVVEYLKRRGVVIAVIAICLGYLISGKIYDGLTYISGVFSSI